MKWKSVKRKLKYLKKWERNPRQATEKQAKDLRESLDKFNLAVPLIINTDNTIIGGHFRYDVLLEKFGENHIMDVRVPDRKLTQKQMEELKLRTSKSFQLVRVTCFSNTWTVRINFNRHILGEV